MCSILDKIETASPEVNSSTKLLALLVEDRFKVMEKHIDKLDQKLDQLIDSTVTALNEHKDCPVSKNKEDVQLFFSFMYNYPFLFKGLIISSIVVGLLLALIILTIVIYVLIELVTTGKSTIVQILIGFMK